MAIIDQELENAGEKQAANIKIDNIINVSNSSEKLLNQHPTDGISNSPKN